MVENEKMAIGYIWNVGVSNVMVETEIKRAIMDNEMDTGIV